MTDPANIILSALAKRLIDKALSVFDHGEIEDSFVTDHLIEVENWSSRMEFYDLPSANDTDVTTIPLDISRHPKLFSKKMFYRSKITELDLLCDNNNYVLLGDPGSGKTTTLKRICRRVLHDDPQPNDIYKYPIVLRLRELQQSATIIEQIANKIGIKYDTSKFSNGTHGVVNIRRHVHEVLNIRRHINGVDLDNIVKRFLNDTNALLIIDGLDEIDVESGPSIRTELASLAYAAHKSKIILTCRTGEYNSHINGFDKCEVRPLTQTQRNKIIKKYTTKNQEFIVELNKVPYADITDRPLMLINLLLLFNNSGHLPNQPTDIYRATIRLVLEKWDQSRSIVRRTRYSNFDSERKLDFLSALAFELTFHVKSKVFLTRNLVSIYRKIHGSYDLPSDESLAVAREIESHTGIIVKYGVEEFEFCHLSLQEYLAAHYLVRLPITDRIISYVNKSPAIVAVAVSIAGDSAKWMAAFLMKIKIGGLVSDNNLESFVSRLNMEAPTFNPCQELGFVALFILSKLPKNEWQKTVEKFFDKSSVKKSIYMSLRHYKITDNNSNTITLSLKTEKPGYEYEVEMGFIPSSSLKVPRRYLNNVIKQNEKETPPHNID